MNAIGSDSAASLLLVSNNLEVVVRGATRRDLEQEQCPSYVTLTSGVPFLFCSSRIFGCVLYCNLCCC